MKKRLPGPASLLLLAACTQPPLVEPAAPRQAEVEGVERPASGFATTSHGARIYFERHGNEEGPGVMVLLAATLEALAPERDGYVRLFGDRYRLLFADYPLGLGESDGVDDPTRMTASQVCDDLLAVADAAGMARFAVVGYSWGGNAALQLAVRSDRVTALVVGGWPAVDGPYGDMLETTTRIAEQLSGADPPPGMSASPRAYWLQFAAYYESLLDWPEREAVESLACPRLNFVDEEDRFEAMGIAADLAEPVRRNRALLEESGWEVAFVRSGAGHGGGFGHEVAGPVIAEFLDRHLTVR